MYHLFIMPEYHAISSDQYEIPVESKSSLILISIVKKRSWLKSIGSLELFSNGCMVVHPA